MKIKARKKTKIITSGLIKIGLDGLLQPLHGLIIELQTGGNNQIIVGQLDKERKCKKIKKKKKKRKKETKPLLHPPRRLCFLRH